MCLRCSLNVLREIPFWARNELWSRPDTNQADLLAVLEAEQAEEVERSGAASTFDEKPATE